MFWYVFVTFIIIGNESLLAETFGDATICRCMMQHCQENEPKKGHVNLGLRGLKKNHQDRNVTRNQCWASHHIDADPDKDPSLRFDGDPDSV